MLLESHTCGSNFKLLGSDDDVQQVDDLKAKLASQEVELAQKNEDANKLIQVVGAETEKVSKEKAIADEEEAKVSKITIEVEAKQRDCEEDLAKAEPALLAAKEALNTLNKVCTMVLTVISSTSDVLGS